MNRPTVFIGSSKEGLHIAEAVQILLDCHAEVTIWNQGVFELNKGYLESLNEALNNFDFAILVLTADDLTHSRQKESPTPRDNVLFELGLFIGGLGRDRCFFIFDDTQNIKLPTDLMGITAATYIPHESGNLQAALGAPCAQIRKVIESLGPRPTLLSTKQSNTHVIPADSSVDYVKSPWRVLLSRRKVVVIALFSFSLGLFLALILIDFNQPLDRSRNTSPSPPYSSEKEAEDIIYLLGSGTVYRYLESTNLFAGRNYIQVLEGPTGAGISLFKNGYDPRVLAMAAEPFPLTDLKQYPDQQAAIYEIYLRSETFQVLFAAGGERTNALTALDNFFLTKGNRLTFRQLREKWGQGQYDIYAGASNSGTRRQWEHYLFDGEKERAYPKTPKEWDIRFNQITDWQSHTLPRIYLGSEVLNKAQEGDIRTSGKIIHYNSLTMIDEYGKDVKRGLYLYGHIDRSNVYKGQFGKTKGFFLPRPVVELLKYIFAFSKDKGFLTDRCLIEQRKYFHIKPYEEEVEGEKEGWVDPSPPAGDGFYRPGSCEERIEYRHVPEAAPNEGIQQMRK